MRDENAKRFQAMILAEYSRGIENDPEFMPLEKTYRMAEKELREAGDNLDRVGGLEKACRGMIRAGALVLRFLADADPRLDGKPVNKV
jgi:hypothetical protein